jgi:hypothetical protein
MHNILTYLKEVFEIFTEPAETVNPTKGPFYHPASWKYLISFYYTLDRFTISRLYPRFSFTHETSLPEYAPSAQINSRRGYSFYLRKNPFGSITVLDTGLMNSCRNDSTFGVNNNMTLSATDLFSSVIAFWSAYFCGFHRLAVNNTGAGCCFSTKTLTRSRLAKISLMVFDTPFLHHLL